MADVYTNPEKHVILHNNVKMPILGLGTSHDGGYSHEAVVYALKNCGYRHIDTAKRYGCEKYIAQAIKASGVSSEDVFLTTKCWPTDYGTNTTREAFNGSCQRLGVNTLDLYLLHWPDVPSGVRDKNSLLLDTWRTLELLLDEERVRSIGVSNFLEPHLEVILNECSVVPHVNQCEFHPYNNPKKLRSYCKERNIQFEGYCPLGNGQILTEPSIQDIAQKHSKSPAQILIRWNLQNRVVCIPKSTKNHRVKENSEVFDFELRTEDMDTLNNMTREIQIMDPSTIQAKIDNPLPDGYKLKLVQIPVEP
ncbi:uncharacterized oxidoreductase ZK1290.5-like isoform X3 [Palaemon carinicauda]|uniref:uncharacterized oxidoreductase ZK1290.5-like isoform X3 n=1 Tax=Palaemon carinicauda TaxID=392227 RepID=UPI0035B62C12